MSALDVELITVPYDSGRRAFRMGAGPLRLLAGGLPAYLEQRGHSAKVVNVELATPAAAEIAASFALAGSIRTHVAEAAARHALPLVLAGNCGSAIGALAALREPRVFWFDAHGDLNTPETTRSGFLDGMALAIVLGRCWRVLALQAGLRPVPAEHVWLLGARDLDPAERELLTQIPVHTTLADGELPSAEGREAPAAYLHVDLDVLDPDVAPANQYAAPGGLTLDELLGAIARIASTHRIAAATLSAYDPAADPEGALLPAAFEVAAHIAAAARS